MSLTTLGDKYVSVKNKNGGFKTYEVLNGTIDYEFLDSSYKSFE